MYPMRFKKICIIHLNQIGDLVFSLPLLKALKENFQDASIHSVVNPFLQDLLISSPFVDHIIPRTKGFMAKFKLLKKIRSEKYDLLICLARSEESLMTTALSKAKIKVGFKHFFWDFSLDVKENIEGHNCWYNNAKLLERLKIEFRKNDYVGLINIDEADNLPNLPEKFAIISPAASRRRQKKAWDPEKFAELILLLKHHFDLTSVIVGSSQDQAYNRIISGNVRKKANANDAGIFDLTGNTNLRSLCSIIRKASLFVGIDSGIMHLASSIDIPVVGLFGPTDPQYVGPQNNRSIVVRKEDMDCVPCHLKSCKPRDCLNQLEVDKVFDACGQLLATPQN
jgi:ADP-heptose:LPS heptosyltransferase